MKVATFNELENVLLMKKQSVIFVFLLAFGLPSPAVWANAGHHDHGTERSAAGQVGSPGRVSRTIEITALDTMRYDKKGIQVKSGETVRFVVTNAGKIRHEFTIGTREEQIEHAKMMASMPGMVHEEGNSVSLEPGVTKELIWQFGKAGAIEIACHLPGHYEAGMRVRVNVKK